MKQRVISATIMIILVVALMIISPYTRILLFTVTSLLSIRELKNVFLKLNIKSAEYILFAYTIGNAIFGIMSIYGKVSSIYLVAWFFLAMFACMYAGIASESIDGKGAVCSLSVLSYPLLPYLLVMLISLQDNWASVFIIACLATWTCDSFALFGGKAFGKHKVAPRVSPNKTTEGCICGAISSIVSGIVSYFIIGAISDPINIWACIIVSVIASTFGQVGDLAASLLKRMVGIKDYSNLIPGHGGMMDRADSLLFSIPVTWFCLYIYSIL